MPTLDELKFLQNLPLEIKIAKTKQRIREWHISNLKIYDKPKELSEFGLKRPPQSWQYIEVLI